VTPEPQNPLGLDAWRVRWSEHVGGPDEKDRAREAAFLEDHWNLGARIHLETAKLLAAEIRSTNQATRRQILSLRLFAEFVNALETTAAWGWALQRRRELRMFLDAFLAYPAKAPDAFYADVLQAIEAERDLVSLLRLPERSTVVTATKDLGTDITARDVGNALDGTLRSLGELAEQYFTHDAVLVTHYNRAKHGATMVRLPQYSTDEDDFQVVAPQRNRAEIANGNWYDIAKFNAGEDMIGRLERNTEAATNTLSQLALLTWAMFRAGLLYSDPAE
jgi:hypothetical protein